MSLTSPSIPTIKRLFAVSGNKCAFPKCPLSLVDEASSKVTGRICHIKARNKGGARYDANQTDKERHGFENLILMCPIHHDIIDSDEDSYTFERLQQIKSEHEKAFQNGKELSDEIANALIDNSQSFIDISAEISQILKGGDNSTNIQAGSIKFGLSYDDVAKIAEDKALKVFYENFTKLSEEAMEIVKGRVEEITHFYLEKLKARNPDLINSFRNPSMQLALYSAQTSYAKYGDKDVADLLVDILLERAEQNERDLLRIVLDESLEIIPNLTVEQLDILSLIFLVQHNRESVNNLEELSNYFQNIIKSVVGNINVRRVDFLHLATYKCASLEGTAGYLTWDMPRLPFKFISDYEEIFAREMKDEEGLNIDYPKALNFLKQQGSFMEKLEDVWNNTDLNSTEITSVGIVIAQANLKKRTGKPYDFSMFK